MRKRTLIESFNCAVEGLVHAFRTQRNMRIHTAAAVLALVFAFAFIRELSGVELLAVLSAIAFVIVCEMFNTAIEGVMDMVEDDHSEQARLVKDVAAGAVLVASLYAVAVGYLIVVQHMHADYITVVDKIRRCPWHITAVGLGLVVILGVGLKLAFGRGQPFRGGMPSIHAAVAFAAWTTVTVVAAMEGVVPSQAALLSFVVLLLAFLVAESRVRDGVHTRTEVALGAVMGILVMLLLFQVLS